LMPGYADVLPRTDGETRKNFWEQYCFYHLMPAVMSMAKSYM